MTGLCVGPWFDRAVRQSRALKQDAEVWRFLLGAPSNFVVTSIVTFDNRAHLSNDPERQSRNGAIWGQTRSYADPKDGGIMCTFASVSSKPSAARTERVITRCALRHRMPGRSEAEPR